MPYELMSTVHALNIAEQQYATAAEIEFTHFTSCIGVITKQGKSLTAIHLVITARDGTVFDDIAIAKVLSILPGAYEKVTIAGHNSWWLAPQKMKSDTMMPDEDANKLADEYKKLIMNIEEQHGGDGWEVDYEDQPEDRPDTRCHATIDGEDIKINWV
jgi:hypothetical protein